MENIKEVLSILQDTKSKILDLLKPNGEMLLISINASFEQMVNKLAFLGGTVIESSNQITFDPITNFMGEELAVVQPIKPEDIQPEKTEVNTFIEKVDTLQKNIASLENKKLLESYVTTEDQLVIRGVAKRAGLEDFRTAEITSQYIDLIRLGLLNKAAAESFKADQDENINKQSGN